jgi:hypothetical protein
MPTQVSTPSLAPLPRGAPWPTFTSGQGVSPCGPSRVREGGLVLRSSRLPCSRVQPTWTPPPHQPSQLSTWPGDQAALARVKKPLQYQFSNPKNRTGLTGWYTQRSGLLRSVRVSLSAFLEPGRTGVPVRPKTSPTGPVPNGLGNPAFGAVFQHCGPDTARWHRVDHLLGCLLPHYS